MNILLIFFAIPIAIIILSIIFEILINNPLMVGGIFFSVILVGVFYLGGTGIQIAIGIFYSVLSFITAFVVAFIRNPNYLCRNCYRNSVPNNLNNEYRYQNFSENYIDSDQNNRFYNQ
jgi:Mn2+/Fe2+ NRAMP family transporter